MDHLLVALSHYLDQCWLEIIDIHSIAISQKIHKLFRKKISFEIKFLKIFSVFAWDNELMHIDQTVGGDDLINALFTLKGKFGIFIQISLKAFFTILNTVWAQR